jgi:PAS domain S-box-containing protein
MGRLLFVTFSEHLALRTLHIERRPSAVWCATGMVAVASFGLGVAQASGYPGIGIGAGFVLILGLALVGKAFDRREAAGKANPGAEKLHAAEAMYRTMVDTAVDAIITIDHRGVIDSFNRAAERLFGYTAAEVIGSNVRILMPDPYASEHDRYLANYLRTGERHIIGIGREVVARRKDGTHFPIDLAVGEWFRGSEPHFTGIIRDLTERKAAEQTLRVSEQRFRSLFTNSPLGKALIGHDQRIREVNPTLCRMLGFAANELEGRTLAEFAASEDRAGFARLGVLLDDRSAQVRFEQRFVTNQRKTAWASVHAVALPGTDDPERSFLLSSKTSPTG